MLKKCQQCGDDFAPYVGRQRFCCTDCAQAFYAAERRRAVQLLRAQPAGGIECVEAPR